MSSYSETWQKFWSVTELQGKVCIGQDLNSQSGQNLQTEVFDWKRLSKQSKRNMKILYWRIWTSSSKNKVKLLSFSVFRSILYTLVLLSGLPSQRRKKKTKYALAKHSSFPLPKKHVFWSSNLEVTHWLFRTQWDCNHEQSCKRACHQGRNMFLALMSYNPGCSAVVSWRTWIRNSNPPLWASTARSCSAMKTPEPFSSTHHIHTHPLVHAVRGRGTAPRGWCQEGSRWLAETRQHGQYCERPRGLGKNTSHPQLEGTFSIIAAQGCSKCVQKCTAFGAAQELI